jgi:hypothetical protein
MSFFRSFTDSLRQKWLQFFQINRDWISVQMEVEAVYTPDGGRRPPSYLILGVVNALEPKLAQLMLPFSKLNPDADTLIEVLDLHFDPDIALGNRVLPKAYESRYEEVSAVVIEEKPKDQPLTIAQMNSYGDRAMSSDNIARELEMVDNRENPVVTDTTAHELQNGFSEQHLQDESHHSSGGAVDEFGDISFDEFNGSQEKGFAEALSDVWSDGVRAHTGEANHEQVLGEEELPSGAFEESEIARLFPNT